MSSQCVWDPYGFANILAAIKTKWKIPKQKQLGSMFMKPYISVSISECVCLRVCNLWAIRWTLNYSINIISTKYAGRFFFHLLFFAFKWPAKRSTRKTQILKNTHNIHRKLRCDFSFFFSDAIRFFANDPNEKGNGASNWRNRPR